MCQIFFFFHPDSCIIPREINENENICLHQKLRGPIVDNLFLLCQALFV